MGALGDVPGLHFVLCNFTRSEVFNLFKASTLGSSTMSQESSHQNSSRAYVIDNYCYIMRRIRGYPQRTPRYF